MPDMVEAARQKLVESLQTYMSFEEQALVAHACDFALMAHAGVLRKSGEPYITHPIAVATILSEFRQNADTIAAALLHDVVEDTDFTKNDITSRFNFVVADLVDGVTKLEESEDKYVNKAATLKKIIAATIHDPRVMIIKLADRLHNLSTLGAVTLEKRKALAQETMQTYVPIGRLLGLTKLVDQVELLCLEQLDADWFKRVQKSLENHKERRQALLQARQQQLLGFFRRLNFMPEFKKPVSDIFIYQQAFAAQTSMSILLDTIQLEILAPSAIECQQLAEELKKHFQYYSFEDHIQQPLPGGRQYIDMQLSDGDGVLQLRILTREMRRTGRFGVLADQKSANTASAVIQASLKSLEGLLGQECLHSSMQDIINYLHHDKMVVYTRDGDPIELPQHATIIDFAYQTSLYLGNHLKAATVNGVRTSLSRTLKSGQQILLELSDEVMTNPDWLAYTVTSKARRAIQQHLRNLSSTEQIEVGAKSLSRALTLYDVALHQLSPVHVQEVLDNFGVQTLNELYLQIATGDLIPQFVAAKLCADVSRGGSNSEGLIKNISGVSYRFAQCCNPIPGDRIFGHLTRRGIAVHRFSCPHLTQESHINSAHLTTLEWQDSLAEDVRFSVALIIQGEMDPNRYSEMIRMIESEQAAVASIQPNKEGIELHVIVKNRLHLAQILRQIRATFDFPQISRVLQFNAPA